MVRRSCRPDKAFTPPSGAMPDGAMLIGPTRAVFRRPDRNLSRHPAFFYFPCIYGVYTPFRLSRNATISSMSFCGISFPT
ncbi:hypothetical protein EVY06_08950 [Citrobacter koseri]|uniref:Uncharacterized protein n=1 Tax=Citrobacter koseri TaxID=545 RepID=A0AAQ0V4L4_CITKO|nr:hypothetical protein AM351_00085 [Citrobacter koseri]AVK73914.1 hypothetical protein CEP66_24460 [Citrobacter koseri]PNN13405.1 hypothetical protein AL526_012180 [Citrobacter koseri]RSC16192.1 hypothetical protein EGS84_04175 [Citrobacter koseri]RZB00831.1 hypothetical protein EVY06_08950 [Citrobacter koseri]